MDIRQTGINFLGFNLSRRKSVKGRPYLHIEPSQKSRAALRCKLDNILNHWTRWKTIESVVKQTNRVLRGWSAYFHYGNSSTVMNRLQYYSRQKLRRWIWRKHNCKHGLWNFCSDEQLHTRYGLYALPLWAAWKNTR